MRPDFLYSLSLAFTAAVLLGCSSTPTSDSAKGADHQEVEWIGPDGPEPYDPNLAKDRREAGVVLADVDKSLRLWNNIVLGGTAAQDGARLNIIEADLRRNVNAKIAILIDQLEFGPPNNRQIAGAALGFSNAKEALGPLVAALDDPVPMVVANALLGLSLLRDPETPRIPIAAKLEDSAQTMSVRSNAGRALRAVGLHGLEEADRDAVVRAGRAALGDEEDALRVHGALILAEVADTESIPALSRSLGDESQMVARASSRALARIGDVEPEYEGQAARALTAALDRVDEDSVRPAILADLQSLAGKNYGDKTEEWVRYAQKLP